MPARFRPSRSLLRCFAALLVLLPAGCEMVDMDDQGGDGSLGGPGPGAGEDVAIVAASLEYGFCIGYCRTEIAIDGAQVVATLSARGELAPLENRGRLAGKAQGQIDDLALDLAYRELQPVYGCPGCADGGISIVELRVGDDVSAHMYEHEQPPDVLEGVNVMVNDMVAAMQTCESNGRVQVASGCTPRPRL